MLHLVSSGMETSRRTHLYDWVALNGYLNSI